MTQTKINYDEHPIDRIYVDWANTIDSTGKNSVPARQRLLGPSTLEHVYDNMDKIIQVGVEADLLKKWVFYGKPVSQLDSVSPLAEGTTANAQILFDHHNMVRVYHAILGLITEAAELMEMFKLHVFEGLPFNWENLTEETGDVLWYVALLARASGHLTFDEFMASNKAKLTARYGSEWSQDGALNRDTENEMKQLNAALPTPMTHEQKTLIAPDMYSPTESLDEAKAKYPTLDSIVAQLSACNYEMKVGYGSIEDNTAFKALRAYAYEEFQKRTAK